MRGWKGQGIDALGWMGALALSCLVWALAAHAGVWSEVGFADSNTPLDLMDPCVPGVYRAIMVGTHLVFVVSSDAGGSRWTGLLSVPAPFLDQGCLVVRGDRDMTTRDWPGSRFPAAGNLARVREFKGYWEGREMYGFQFAADDDGTAGDWFILDYVASQVGPCVVEFYDDTISWFEATFVHVFDHVPTRDFNGDGRVGFEDYAQVAGAWRTRASPSGDNPTGPGAYDLDSDGEVGMSDLRLFLDYWLDRTR